MTRVLNWKLPAAAALAALLAALVLVPSGAEAHHLADVGLELPDVVEVSSGWMHTCGRTSGGEVYCWGNNATGNLGDGTAANVRPVAKRVVGFDAPVTQVSSGADHTCALTSLGKVWCWGGNLAGQLGGLPADLGLVRRKPGQVPFFQGQDPTFVQISAGNSHTCALEEGGIPWCWGSDTQGQLGRTGMLTDSGLAKHVWIADMGRAKRILAGASHTCALNLTDELWCWGNNREGQVGDGTTLNRREPVRVALTNGFPDGGVVDFAVGTYHTCATTQSRHVYCWGDNGYGRLGSPVGYSSDTPVQVRKFATMTTTGEFVGMVGVSVGLDHSCAWTPDGKGWCWGRALYGQLGDVIVSSHQPVPRWPVYPRDVLELSTGKILSISAGYNHTCSTNEGGKAYCWGHNGFGQNGDGTFVFHKEPAKVFQLGDPL